ncbi:MAG TPA: AAA family ATPase [Vicinamibacterales bacterium]
MSTSTIAASSDLTTCESFYGLLARPFSLTPDLRFVFHSRSHSRALEQVTEALKRREGVVVITGGIGTGKTMLCRTLLETFEPRTFLSVILDPCLSVSDLLHQVLTDFGIIDDVERTGDETTPDITRHQLVTTLQKFLSTLIPLDAHAVIMIDEAQHLDPSVLEEVRLLSNFETDTAKLLQIVLVGQPDLDVLLKRPEMGQLRQRIARRVELHPLAASEVKEYIERRLFVAAEAATEEKGDRPAGDPQVGAALERVRFTPAAIQTIAAISAGIPRVVNTLCDRVLELGCERQTRVLDHRLVLDAAARLKLPVPALVKMRSGAGLKAAAAALFVIAGLGSWWWASRPAPAAPPQVVQHVPAPPVAAKTQAPTTAPPASPTAARPAESAPPTPAPAASAAAPAPQKNGRYGIFVAAFKTTQRTADVAASIAQKGLPVTTRTDSTGTWHQIVVGPYDSPEQAEAAQRILTREGFVGTRISVLSPDVR